MLNYLLNSFIHISLFYYLKQHNTHTKPTGKHQPKGKLIAIGGCAIDYQLSPKQGVFELYKSCIGKTKKSLGGIARNIVDCSSKLGISCTLISAIGTDTQSQMIRSFCQKQDINLVEINENKGKPQSSGKYYAILDHNNNELLGISEMEINEILTFDRIYERFFRHQQSLSFDSPDRISKQDIIVVDSNISELELKKIVQYCSEQFGSLIVYEAKGKKSKRIVTSGAFPYIDILKMNVLQKNQIQSALSEIDDRKQYIYNWLSKSIGSKGSQQSEIRAIITKGSEDVEVVYKSMTSKHLMVPKPGKIEKTTGAGDTFTGAFCSMLLYGKQQDQALLYARAASKINIESPVNQSVISDRIDMGQLDALVAQLKQKYTDI